MPSKIIWFFLSILLFFGCSEKNIEDVATITHEDSLVLARLDELNRKDTLTSTGIDSTAVVKQDSLNQDSTSIVVPPTPSKDSKPSIEVKPEILVKPTIDAHPPVAVTTETTPKTTAIKQAVATLTPTDKNKIKPASTLPALKNFAKGSSENTIIVPSKKDEAASLNFYEQGLKKFQAGDYAGSIPLFDKAIEMNPSNIEAYNKRGMAKGELGAHSDAIEDFSNTEAMQKKMELEALLNLAEIKYKTNDYSGAITDYTYIIGNNLSNSYEIYYKRGLAKFRYGKYEDAYRDFTKTTSLAPTFGEAYVQKGISQTKLKRYKEAITDFTDAVRVNPKDKLAYVYRGIAKTLLKDLKGAKEDYSKSIEIDSRYEEAYLQRADANEKLGLPAEAIKDLSKVIEINPRHKEAYMKRGHLNLAEIALHQAAADFAKASELDPKDGDACYYRGIAEMESKKNYDACISFKKASQLGNAKAPAMMSKTCR